MVMLDVKGDEIRPGDTIAVAFRSSTVAYQRVGTVQMILDDTRELLVEWHAGWHLPASKATKIAYYAKKIVRF